MKNVIFYKCSRETENQSMKSSLVFHEIHHIFSFTWRSEIQLVFYVVFRNSVSITRMYCSKMTFFHRPNLNEHYYKLER